MRAPAAGTTGNIGETEVTAKFERLGWGVAPNPRHDLGTDLWLMPRDARLFDLGLIAGAQVKTTKNAFPKLQRDPRSGLLGWWVRPRNPSHFDAWLAHAAPHLVVFHSMASRASHWVHVTPDAVVRTGKGAKILVPVGNTIHDICRDELLRAVSTQRHGRSWEGSAWAGAADIATCDHARYSLIVPRLVAPHPNAGHAEPVTAQQGLAMLVQARFRELQLQAEQHPSVPGVNEAIGSSSWDWRFVGALGLRTLQGDSSALANLIDVAPDPSRRAAVAVTAGAALMEDGQPERALVLLQGALDHDDAEPVDHAWLTAQMARACVDVGRIDEARDLAARVQAIGATHAHDPTAAAIVGAAAILLFVTTDWRSADVSSAVIGCRQRCGLVAQSNDRDGHDGSREARVQTMVP